jgi:DNA-binding CsgD family transcriptional regulator
VRDLTVLAERVRAGEPCRVLITGLTMLARVQYRLGRWDDSAMNAQLAVSLGEDVGVEFPVAFAHAAGVFVAAGRGQFDLAQAHLDSAADVVASAPAPAGRFVVSVARAVLAQARGQPDELRSATAPLLDGRIRPSVEWLDRSSWQALAIEGLLGSGEVGAARDLLADLADLVETQRMWSPRPDLARLAGQIAEASNDRDAALAEYGAGLQRSAGPAPLPLPAARLHLAYGSLLRRTGNRRAAVDQLRTAHTILTALGAAPFVMECHAELSACGLTAPSVARSDALQLTPAEQSVAHLVAQGLSNRETAARLYVSPKTVDYHLGHIYAKLGITSRRELGSRLRSAS